MTTNGNVIIVKRLKNVEVTTPLMLAIIKCAAQSEFNTAELSRNIHADVNILENNRYLYKNLRDQYQ
jgi:hypothetical protein